MMFQFLDTLIGMRQFGLIFLFGCQGVFQLLIDFFQPDFAIQFRAFYQGVSGRCQLQAGSGGRKTSLTYLSKSR
jgi:hypothetical protein